MGSRRTGVTSLSLTPEGRQILEHLAQAEGKNHTQVMEWLLRMEASRRGFYFEQRRESIMRMELVTKKGRELPIVIYQGEKYAQGEEGEEYTIRLINDSADRRLAILTVDGVNIVSGEDGKVDGDGYVLQPWQTLNIEGWRRDEKEAAAFKFGKIGESYANKTGRGETNVGIIGAAVFDEVRVRGSHLLRTAGPLDWKASLGSVKCSTSLGSGQSGSVTYTSSMDSTRSLDVSNSVGGHEGVPVCDSGPAAQDLGTEYGNKVEFRTTTVSFNKKPEPSEMLKVRYASKEVLRSWGIPVDAVPPKPPEAFPADQKGVPPPPGWRG
jgi:hypothetical protein